MENENNIVRMQMDLTTVVEDVYTKIRGLFEKYTNEASKLPPLPEYLTIIKVPAEYYKYYAECLHIGDEIICVMTAMSIITTSLQDILKTKLTRDLSNEYSLVNGFRTFLENHLDNIKRYRFDLNELKRQVTDRVKLLQAISYQQ